MPTSERAIFVSDLHLIDSTDPNSVLFVKLLAHLNSGNCTQLFLLGDVFDLWIANHKFFIERFQNAIEALRALAKRGVEIHYFEGNHDLDLRPFFANELKINVHEDATLLTIAGIQVRLEHGDQMDPEDRDYLFLRWLLRTPVVRWLGRHMPSKVVHWIGVAASRKSRNYTSIVRDRVGRAAVIKKIERHADLVFSKTPFDLLISGHVHVAIDQKNKFRIVNLGTWLEQPMLFELSLNQSRLIAVQDFLKASSV